MQPNQALTDALELFRNPVKANFYRGRLLPDGIDILLKGASDEAVLDQLQEIQPHYERQKIRDATGFYIEQVLLHPYSDPYRILGADETATREQLRNNMAALLMWLHPDRNSHDDRTIYTERVLAAWEQLKSDQAREEYDSLAFLRAPRNYFGNNGAPLKRNRQVQTSENLVRPVAGQTMQRTQRRLLKTPNRRLPASISPRTRARRRKQKFLLLLIFIGILSVVYFQFHNGAKILPNLGEIW
jgi:hypothetical protein